MNTRRMRYSIKKILMVPGGHKLRPTYVRKLPQTARILRLLAQAFAIAASSCGASAIFPFACFCRLSEAFVHVRNAAFKRLKVKCRFTRLDFTR